MRQKNPSIIFPFGANESDMGEEVHTQD